MPSQISAKVLGPPSDVNSEPDDTQVPAYTPTKLLGRCEILLTPRFIKSLEQLLPKQVGFLSAPHTLRNPKGVCASIVCTWALKLLYRTPFQVQEYTVQVHEAGLIFFVPPKGHPIYTLTNIKKGTLYTRTKNKNVNPASQGPFGEAVLQGHKTPCPPRWCPDACTCRSFLWSVARPSEQQGSRAIGQRVFGP